MEIIDYLYIFTLAAFTGYVLIQKVPSQLHTPLMSGSNAISGITIVGAILAAGSIGGDVVAEPGTVDSIASATTSGGPSLGTILGFVALVLATINVVGGYMVTDRMLGMFRSKKSAEPGK
jgi:NAD(P) transhydrogenase subunit alpha